MKKERKKSYIHFTPAPFSSVLAWLKIVTTLSQGLFIHYVEFRELASGGAYGLVN